MFAVLAVLMLELIDDSVELDLLTGVLVADFCPGRQQDLELLALGAIKKDLDVALSQILEGYIEAELKMSGETMEEPAPPTIATVIHRGGHWRFRRRSAIEWDRAREARGVRALPCRCPRRWRHSRTGR